MRSVVGRFTAAIVAVFLAAGMDQARADTAGLEDLDDAELDQAVEFILGNALFVLMHEAGHMLVSEFGIPVLGREEDAVDALSTLIMLEASDEVFDNALVDASDGWFLSGAASDDAGYDYAFWDEHSVDEQRAYAIICMMVGHDAERFSGLEAAQEMPEERRDRCASDFEQASASWTQVLEPHMRDDGAESPVSIVYDDAPDEDTEIYAGMFREADLLGIAKALIADQFLLEEGITFRASSCGVENAFWSPGERTMTFCYELSRFHAKLIAEYLKAQR